MSMRVFEMQLQPGPNLVRAWLINADGKEQGAYYVYVRLIKDARKEGV